MSTLLPDPDIAVAELAEAIDQERADSYPLVLSSRRLAAPTEDYAAVLDALVAEEGYQGLGANWVEVPRRIAVKVLAHVIGGELAYPTEVMPAETVNGFVEDFLALVPPKARYFTNGACSGEFAVYNQAGEEVLGWRSISKSTFDNGLIALGSERVALVWAEDESD